MKHILSFAILLLFSFSEVFSQIILPTPFQMSTKNCEFILNPANIALFSADTTSSYVQLFREVILGDKTVSFAKCKSKADICFVKDNSLPCEGYKIEIGKRGITVKASVDAGFIYAIRTLQQWGEKDERGWVFTHGGVYDYPRAKWRSFMLDSGRQYQKPETIKKYIEMASILKMNYFHWHLTEGLGWRIEIERYPDLASKGGCVATDAEQQGFYTKDEIRDIVDYAAKRNITIIPEIDMPGHAEAALSVFPELGCTGLPVKIPETGFTPNIFCAGRDSVINFLKNVLDEVCQLFPSPYIHLGGDEAPKDNWNKCKYCRQRIDSLNLKNSTNLQLWFSAEMATYLKTKGKKVIFWEDVIHNGEYPLPNNTIIQWWNYRTHKNLAYDRAMKYGSPIICNTNYYTYLNFPVHAWSGYGEERTFDLRDVYTSNPSDVALQSNSPLVLGMSCALWTDYNVTEDMIDSRLFPRIIALSEQMWHQGERKDFETFYTLVTQKKDWFQQTGFEYGPILRD